MMQGRFAVLSSKYDIICVLNYTSMPFIALHSQRRWLSYNVNLIHEEKRIFYVEGFELKKQFFNLHFLN